MLSLYVSKSPVELRVIQFPAGESLVQISREPRTDVVTARTNAVPICITMKFESNKDLIDLMLLVDAVRRYFYQPIELSLVMDYLPYARQDRVCNKGESLSVKVIADLINSLKFDHVYCKDIHSDVGAALLNNLIHIDLVACARNIHNQKCFDHRSLWDVVLVSPDAGANKKVFNLARAVGYKEVVRADKKRDVATGAITETVVYSEHVGNKDFLIVDDILDHGGTFIPLADKLRSLTDGKVYLYVTHGMFNSGVDKFHGYFDKIFVSNLMMKKEFVDTHGILAIV